MKRILNKFQSLNTVEKAIVIFFIALLAIILFRTILSNSELISGMLILFGPALLLIAWLIFRYISRKAKLARIATEYENAKDALRKKPGNVKLREAALAAGRNYYASLRDGTLSIYDEQALSNDLNTIMGSNPRDNEE
jgi:Zn-dependent protease with chaperone function